MNRLLTAYAIALVLPACAGESNDASSTNEESANLVAAVEPELGRRVEFYEPQPGVMWISQTGTDSQAPLGLQAEEGTAASMVDIYKRLAPGQEVPRALVEAQARVQQRDAILQALQPSSATSSISSGGGSATGPSDAPDNVDSQVLGLLAFSDTDFVNGYSTYPFCPTSGSLNAYNWCLTNWWGGAWYQSNATDMTWATVYADIGNIKFNVSTGRGGGQWTVDQGYWRQWYSGYSTCGLWNWCDFYARYDITEAAGDRFHFGGSFRHRD